jgi:hypothetical protein
MNAHKYSRNLIITLCAALVLLLSACQPATPVTSSQPTLPITDEPFTQVTQAPVQPTEPSGELIGDITLDYSAVAEDLFLETVPAQPASDGGPYWEAAPEFRLMTLEGYPVADHLLKPQIFIYPVGELASANEAMGKVAADLQSLLQSQQSGEYLPFLPLYNAAQVMQAQVKYLNFDGFQGVRFLTQYDQAPLPINNNELIYTFQGLSSDGKFYIAAVLPVTNLELPAGSEVSEQQAEAMNDFPSYLSNTVNMLNQEPAGSFTPALDELDAMIGSLVVR